MLKDRPAGQIGRIFRSAINGTAEACTGLVERHPYLWKLAWEAVHRLPFLLPHDKSYKALRHFIAIKPDGLFLDIGANDGISALSFRKFSTKYRILSLEPNPLLKLPLEKLKAADPLFDYKIVGAGSTAGRMTFFVPLYKNVVLHTFTSVNRDHLLDAITESFGSSVASKIEIKAFESEIIPLDVLSLNPTIVKIDAEGFDYAVLQGLNETIRRARPFIIIEIARTEYDEIISYLRKQRYSLLSYNLFTDCFNCEFLSWDAAVCAMSGHSNFFAVPEEMTKLIPVK